MTALQAITVAVLLATCLLLIVLAASVIYEVVIAFVVELHAEPRPIQDIPRYLLRILTAAWRRTLRILHL